MFVPLFWFVSTCRSSLGWLQTILEGWDTFELIRKKLELGYACLLTSSKFLYLFFKDLEKVFKIGIVDLFLIFSTHQKSDHLEVYSQSYDKFTEHIKKRTPGWKCNSMARSAHAIWHNHVIPRFSLTLCLLIPLSSLSLLRWLFHAFSPLFKPWIGNSLVVD